jgi:hypothetical protein
MSPLDASLTHLKGLASDCHRTGQDRTGQDRTGQDRTGQDRTVFSSLSTARFAGHPLQRRSEATKATGACDESRREGLLLL